MNSPLQRRSKGFSATELLILMAIIAVLVVLSTAAISRVNRTTLTARCVTNLKTLGTAFHQFITDHEGRFPPTPNYIYINSKRKGWRYRIISSTWEEEAREEFREAIRRAGLSGMVQPVNDIGEALDDGIGLLAAYRHLFQEFGETIVQATKADDLSAAKKAGRTGVIFSLTGLPVFGAGTMADPDSIFDWIELWYLLGVRFMHVGYNRRNYFADGCTESRDGGLSDFGRELVRRLNRAGIIVDLPHSSPQTLLDAVRESTRPVMATHLGCQAVYAHPRSKSDRELKAIAETDGLVGIFAEATMLGPGADLNLLLRHVAHAVKTVGARHVSIGTDLAYQRPWNEPIPHSPQLSAFVRRAAGIRSDFTLHASDEHRGGSLTWTNWPLFTVGLLRLGLREGEIEAILGGNLRRVLEACRSEQGGGASTPSLSAGENAALSPGR